METFCIGAAIIGLTLFAYRGWSIILIAPFFAGVAAILSEFGIMPVYSELYMTRFAEYTKTYYPVFLFGAVFARLMEKGGLASAIAGKIMSLLGEQRAILAVILGCAALTYGGLSVFVVAFVMYPFGAEIFRKANIPKKLLPATLWMGIFSFAMVALPGTPQIQNIIPSSYFGTSTWAGVGIGLFASILYLVMSMGWLTFRSKSLQAKGEGYGGEIEQKQRKDRTLPDWKFAMIPLLMVIVINIILSNPFHLEAGFHWDETSLEKFIPFNLSLLAASVGKVQAIWSISVALIVSSIAAAWIGRRRYLSKRENFLDTINFGAASSCAAVLNVSSGFAFGSVMVSMPGFFPIREILIELGNSAGPLVSAVVTTNIMGAITGSASGGLTLALSMLGEQWATMATAQGISLDALHRIVSVAAIGIDPVPHAGALVTLLAICGLTHKDSYFDIIVLMVLKFFVPFLCILFYMLTGIA